MHRKSIRITVLRCPECGNDLDGLSTDTIFFCTECGRCLVFGDTLAPVEIEFTRHNDSGTILLPFWKVDATVNILSRITRSESRTVPIVGKREFHGGNLDLVESFTAIRRDLIIFPAFSTSLVLSTGVMLNEEEFSQNPLQHGKYPPMIGGCIGLEDASKLASGVAVGIEVSKSDYLAFIDLDIDVHSVKVLAIGCTPSESTFRINGTDINIPFSTVKDADDILKRSGHNS